MKSNLTRLISILSALVIFIFISCEKYPTQDHFPSNIESEQKIEAIKIEISHENILDLKTKRYTNTWFPINVAISNSELSSNFNPALIRNQGHMARDYLKESYKIKWQNKKEDQYNYSGQSVDKSLCRYKLANYYISKTSMLQPDLVFNNLFINDNWKGLYLKIEIIDENFFTKRNLKLSHTYKTNFRANLTMKEGMLPEQGFDKKLPENNNSYETLEQLISIIDNGNIADLNDIIDINNVIDYIAISKITTNTDGIVNNYYLYYNPDILKFQIIPWDLDKTFRDKIDLNKSLSSNALFKKIESDTLLKQQIDLRIKELIDIEKDTTYLNEIIDLTTPYSTAQYMYYNDPEAEINSSINAIKKYLEQLNIELIEFKDSLD